MTPLSKRPVWSAVIAQFSHAFSRISASPHCWAVVLLTAPLVASTTGGVAGRVKGTVLLGTTVIAPVA